MRKMLIKDFFKDDGYTLDWDFISMHPVFVALGNTVQSPVWHKEGDVLVHTKLVCERMAELLKGEEGTMHYRIMMVAAACHDLGKPDTTQFDVDAQDYKCHGHGDVGDKIVRDLLFEETPINREKICYIVRNHMTFHYIERKNEDGRKRKLIEMSWGYVPVSDMLLMKIADSRGSLNDTETEKSLQATVSMIRETAGALACFDKPYAFPDHRSKRRFFTDGKIVGESKAVSAPEHTVYFMFGLPGSGKDFVLSHLLSNDVTAISREEIRAEMGVKYSKTPGTNELESIVAKEFKDRIVKACVDKRDVVINDANLTLHRRQKLQRLLLRYNVKVVYMIVDTDVRTCKMRSGDLVHDSLIDDMVYHMDFPTPLEYDEASEVHNGQLRHWGEVELDMF